MTDWRNFSKLLKYFALAILLFQTIHAHTKTSVTDDLTLQVETPTPVKQLHLVGNEKGFDQIGPISTFTEVKNRDQGSISYCIVCASGLENVPFLVCHTHQSDDRACTSGEKYYFPDLDSLGFDFKYAFCASKPLAETSEEFNYNLLIEELFHAAAGNKRARCLSNSTGIERIEPLLDVKVPCRDEFVKIPQHLAGATNKTWRALESNGAYCSSRPKGDILVQTSTNGKPQNAADCPTCDGGGKPIASVDIKAPPKSVGAPSKSPTSKDNQAPPHSPKDFIRDLIRVTKPPANQPAKHLEVCIALDVSGSMESKIRYLREHASRLTRAWRSSFKDIKIHVVQFGHVNDPNARPSTDDFRVGQNIKNLDRYFDGISAWGSIEFRDEAIAKCADQFSKPRTCSKWGSVSDFKGIDDDQVARHIVVFSDEQGNHRAKSPIPNDLLLLRKKSCAALVEPSMYFDYFPVENPIHTITCIQGGKEVQVPRSTLRNGFRCKTNKSTWTLANRTVEDNKFVWRDENSGLYWSDIIGPQMNLDAAKTICSASKSLSARGGRSDLNWRLPTWKDYADADENGIRAVIPYRIPPRTPKENQNWFTWFWTGSPWPEPDLAGTYYTFYHRIGALGSSGPQALHLVRCVGQEK